MVHTFSSVVAASTRETLIEISAHDAPGYAPLVDYGAWRVAMLNAIDELLPERLTTMQRHDETDEVFVLLRGQCILFLGEGNERVTRIHAVVMEPFKVYTIKRGVWHTHTLSADASVLVVENRDTTDINSPHIALTEAQRAELVRMANEAKIEGRKR